jgi:hypothetical protein
MTTHPPMTSARTQAAIVRSLVDAFEHASSHVEAERWLRAQLVEELARLGCKILDVASALTDTGPPISGREGSASCLQAVAP